ncbi:MAG: acetyl-CoA carboxylase carboxyltransferase subunit alpha [Rhodomicrobium sp.]
MRTYLDFEKPIAELESKIEELTALGEEESAVSIKEEIVTLREKAQAALEETYANLEPWQKTQVARHPERPHTLDYIRELAVDFTPLGGDRYFGEDLAIIGGLARFHGRTVMILGHEKGADTQGRLKHNFGMAKPEGYRKAVRLMEMADRFGLPVISLVDTAGAYPGIEAEERGQAEAIARSTACCLSLSVPMIAVIIGEGGSGGAVAVASANRVLMLEHAIYSVISPEGAASILWHDSSKARDAATNMKITAQDLLQLGIIDGIIAEPVGGAHRDPDTAIQRVGEALELALLDFDTSDGDGIRRQRQEKFLSIGKSLPALR